jgi:hypothetical protein
MEQAHMKLQALCALWLEKRGARLLPSRGDLPVSALRPWLGNLALIDLGGPSPHFRLCGTGLHARFGGEMTSRDLDAVSDAHGRRELASCIETAKRTLSPAPMVHALGHGHGRTVFHDLCLSLGNNGRQPDTMLFASYAERES